MADELKITAKVVHSKTPKLGFSPPQFSFDQTGTGVFITTQNIGTSEENVDLATIFADLGTFGWCYMQNLDATNYVSWGASATTPTLATIGRMEAGEPALFRLEPSVTMRMQANTAACDVMVIVWED